jgi:hypothetical protein
MNLDNFIKENIFSSSEIIKNSLSLSKDIVINNFFVFPIIHETKSNDKEVFRIFNNCIFKNTHM